MGLGQEACLLAGNWPAKSMCSPDACCSRDALTALLHWLCRLPSLQAKARQGNASDWAATFAFSAASLAGVGSVRCASPACRLPAVASVGGAITAASPLPLLLWRSGALLHSLPPHLPARLQLGALHARRLPRLAAPTGCAPRGLSGPPLSGPHRS